MGQTCYEEVRESVLNHMAHHRGQPTVYLRMNDAKVPAWGLLLQGAWAVFLVLPRTYNTTDSMALAPDGRVIVAVPNYNNLSFAK